MFVRRYMSDAVHRVRPEQALTYCDRKVVGEIMRRPTKLSRCEKCALAYAEEQESARRAKAASVILNGKEGR